MDFQSVEIVAGTVYVLVLIVIFTVIKKRIINEEKNHDDQDLTSNQVKSGQQIDCTWKPISMSRDMGGDYQVQAASFADHNGFLGNVILISGCLSIYPNNFPRAFRNFDIDYLLENDNLGGSDKRDPDPTFLLKAVIQLKPQITTFDICLHQKFLPKTETLKAFLASQSDALENLYVSCVFHYSYFRVPKHPFILDLPVLSNLRIFKIMRSTARERISLSVPQPICNVLPVLESLTLSADGWEDWSDIAFSEKPVRGNAGLQKCETVTHLCILQTAHTNIESIAMTLSRVSIMLPNLVSLEIPASVQGDNEYWHLIQHCENLKQLTLIRDLDSGPDIHYFDKCITGYSDEVCAEILNNPDQDPEEILLNTIVNRRLNGLLESREAKVRTFSRLEMLRINCESGDWGPTRVSCQDFLNMAFLEVLDFCGGNPKHIPNDMLQNMKEQFVLIIG